MKVDTVKLILALALAIVLGLVCYLVAPEEGSREWIALAVGAVSMAILLVPAFALDYPAAGGRGTSAKAFAWTAALVVLVTDIAFSAAVFKPINFIVVVLLELVVSILIIYSAAQPRK